MNRDEMRAKCVELKLDPRYWELFFYGYLTCCLLQIHSYYSFLYGLFSGVKDVLRKRLKSYYKRQKLMHSAAADGNSHAYFDYICVVDFEATCEENNPSDYLHEIIEFPIVLIDTRTLEIVSWWGNSLAYACFILARQTWYHTTSLVKCCRIDLLVNVCNPITVITGRLISGVCEASGEPSALWVLCETYRNHTGKI